MGVEGIIPRAEVGKSTGCRRLSRLYRCLIGMGGRYEAGWRGWRRSSSLRLSPFLEARVLSIFFFFSFFSSFFFPPSPHARARFSSAQPAARRVTGGGPPRHWLKAWKTGHPRRAIGQGSPLSSSCQSGAWLNLWMIKRWMVSARVVKSPRFEPRSWSFPRFILFTWHVTWRLFHEASRRKLHTIRWISRSST